MRAYNYNFSLPLCERFYYRKSRSDPIERGNISESILNSADARISRIFVRGFPNKREHITANCGISVFRYCLFHVIRLKTIPVLVPSGRQSDGRKCNRNAMPNTNVFYGVELNERTGVEDRETGEDWTGKRGNIERGERSFYFEREWAM